MNFFYLYKLNVGEGYVLIEAIIPIEHNGNVIEVIPIFEFHFDDFSDGNVNFFPKIGEHILTAQKRIESYVKK